MTDNNTAPDLPNGDYPTREMLEKLALWMSVSFDGQLDDAALGEKILNMPFGYYDGMDADCLCTLARLRQIKLRGDETPGELRRLLRKKDGLRKRMRNKARRWMASALASMLGEHIQEAAEQEDSGDKAANSSLKHDLARRGVAPALADRLKGAADEYISVKLDEIERRIDAKLDQIDDRLSQWRDREIENRLKIIRLTLSASVLIAVISVVYAWLKKKYGL